MLLGVPRQPKAPQRDHREAKVTPKEPKKLPKTAQDGLEGIKGITQEPKGTPKNGFFVNGLAMRPHGLKLGPSGSELRCASFWIRVQHQK